MTSNENNQIYEIEVTYQDAGFSLGFDMAEWQDRIKDDLSSFDAIKDFYRQDVEEMAKQMSEHSEEIAEEETPDGPGIVISNPPKEWKEDFGRAAPYLRLAEEQMVQMALYSLVEEEIDAQQELVGEGRFKPLIIRQSAFFESFLEFKSQLAFQQQKEAPLSNNEMSVIEGMGHTDRIRLAHLFGVIDEEEHGYLQSMASLRNKLAHLPWGQINGDEETNIEATARKVLEILKREIEQADQEFENTELETADDDFDIGFSGLDADTQLLQLSILDVLASDGGKGKLSRMEKVLPRDSDEIRQRCLRMDHIGYVDLDKETKIVTMQEKGEELLHEEYRNSNK